MKPEPAPHIPGNTPSERVSNALRKVLTVSKADLLKAEAQWKRMQTKKKRARKVDDVVWQEPEFRQKYESRSKDLTVGPRETQNTQLRLIPIEEME